MAEDWAFIQITRLDIRSDSITLLRLQTHLTNETQTLHYTSTLHLSVFAQEGWYLAAGLSATSSDPDFGSFNDAGLDIVDEKLGFQLGIGQILELSKKVSWNNQLLFNTKGHQDPASLNFGDTYHLNYLDVYSLARLGLTKRLSAAAGPYAGVLLWHRSDFEDHTRFDFGGPGDIQFQVAARFGLNLRYAHGLINTLPEDALIITDDTGNATGDQVKYRNRSLQISVHYSI